VGTLSRRGLTERHWGHPGPPDEQPSTALGAGSEAYPLDRLQVHERKLTNENLARLVAGQELRVDWYKRVRWDRLIGTVWAVAPNVRCRPPACPKTLDAGLAQVTQGLARHFKRYAHEQSPDERERYAFAEQEARARKAGLWQEPDPVPPWEWRRR
jgi:endonuclease YncB( thermonuclease family)